MTAATQHIEATLGEGIFLMKDVAKILQLDYNKVYRWIVGYWKTGLNGDIDYTFGEDGNKAINFYSLIEFYTFFKLREKGVSSSEIKKFHASLVEDLKTPYPFAIANEYFVENRKTKKTKKTFVYYKYCDSLIKFSKKKQFSFDFLDSFLEKIEFDDNNMAVRFYPLDKSKNVVVDPRHQFGQPTIAGTNIKTQTIYSLYNGGETLENISYLYNLSHEKVRDAISFQNAA